MQNNCMVLNNEFTFFQNLLLNLLTRRVVFKKFEDGMKNTHLTEHNDVVALFWYGYIVSQLSDCRKFFDRDNNAHSFQFVVRHLKNDSLRKKHGELFETWKNGKLETVINKYLLHADMRFEEIDTKVSVQVLNSFIDELEKYIKQMIDDLAKNYSIGALNYDGFLPEREREVDIFFEQVRK